MAALEAPDLRLEEPGAGASRPLTGSGVQPRSYLADGRRITWRVDAPDGWRVAVDAERADQELPPHVRARSGLAPEESTSRALASWTQAEVMAKLTDTPILLRLRRYGLGLADLGEHEPIAMATHAVDGLVVTVGTTWK